MMKIKPAFFNIIAPIAHRIPLEPLIRSSGIRLFLPFYHAVADEAPPHIKHLYRTRTVEEFRSDLAYMLRFYTPISLQTLLYHTLEGVPFEKPSFHLTFDDGLREVYDTVAPILLREGVPATIFLNSAFVDNRALMFRYKASLLMEHLGLSGRHSGLLETSYSFAYQLDDFATRLHYDFRDFLATQKPYLTSDQIRELAAKGFTFGGHSHTHPLFADISLTDQLQQAELSVNAVQRVFAQPCRVFAFPFTGDGVGEEFFRAAPIDLAFGSGGLKTSPYKNYLQRVPMEGTHHSAAELIGAEYLYALAKQKLHNYLPNSK